MITVPRIKVAWSKIKKYFRLSSVYPIFDCVICLASKLNTTTETIGIVGQEEHSTP